MCECVCEREKERRENSAKGSRESMSGAGSCQEGSSAERISGQKVAAKAAAKRTRPCLRRRRRKAANPAEHGSLDSRLPHLLSRGSLPGPLAASALSTAAPAAASTSSPASASASASTSASASPACVRFASFRSAQKTLFLPITASSPNRFIRLRSERLREKRWSIDSPRSVAACQPPCRDLGIHKTKQYRPIDELE
eukprot:6185900-Pleurochrysis_carterae.AAC.3